MRALLRPALLAAAIALPALPVALQSSAFASPDAATEAQAAAAQAAQQAEAAAWSQSSIEALAAYIDRLDREGLDPANYGAARLRQAAASGNMDAANQLATATFMRLGADLSGGAVRGGDRVQWYMAPSGLNEQQLQRLLGPAKAGRVDEVLNGLLPTHPQYIGLRRALANTAPGDTARRDLIRTNMERWRWLPRNLGARHVIVNVPAFTAALVENGAVVARHRTVVGALATQTPQLSATITAVTFNPWWTVPQSIARTMRGTGGYEVRQGDGYRIIRQPPGPRNALGRVKIEMPNEHAIYLHDTPSQHLFAQARRAYSHGCIRTHMIRDFAELILAPTGQWDRARIDRTINAGQTVQARLAQPMPVYIAYFTAAATNDGNIVTYDDVYGRDVRVRQALNRTATNTRTAGTR